MKTIHVRALLVFAMVIVPLAAGTMASANGLTHHQMVIPIDATYLWSASDPVDPSPCGFDLIFHEDGNWRINYWTDENGWWLREFDIYGNVHRTGSAVGGDKTVNIIVRGQMKYEVTYLDDTATVVVKSVGAQALTVAPGLGVIWGGSGLILETQTFDISDPEQWVLISYSVDKDTRDGNYDDFTELCGYLRP